ncbi:class I SAM-dependent methyltransferase [Aminobacter ciceronei]|jgi:ubiquinone/menaquinone biosynthesis C-methylase UbiE|uniref:class I SAM-dependent methyltransferase n=1 Tax=Aminobacter ciceronei TaxID=150723 RepID=UPI003F70DE5F
MNSSEKAKLDESVAVVGAPWAESPYYDDAEKWTHIFWNSGTQFRRLFDQIDLSSVAELSCGHGRHAERVARMATNLTLLDIHQANLDFCQRRLASHPSIRYVLGNGYSFEPIDAASVTGIYCYDSMVHFSPDIVQNYLRDTVRVLKPGGMGLFHHSNYPAPTNRHYGQNPHARNHMSQELFKAVATAAGLSICESVVIPWGDFENLDCLTLVQRPA